jgi:hypothetical protein
MKHNERELTCLERSHTVTHQVSKTKKKKKQENSRNEYVQYKLLNPMIQESSRKMMIRKKKNPQTILRSYMSKYQVGSFIS